MNANENLIGRADIERIQSFTLVTIQDLGGEQYVHTRCVIVRQ